jgi:CheY-like chemotaxis protein
MDCQMPEMDGYEATRALRRDPLLSKVYIIAMTANAMQGDKEKCLECGMNDYVPKPIRVNDLAAALKRSLPIDFGGRIFTPSV